MAYGPQYPGQMMFPQTGYYQPMYQQPMMQNPYPTQMQPAAQQMQQNMPQQVAQTGINAKIVKNRKEMEEEQIGFGNDVHVFLNVQGDEIYTKRFNPETGSDDVRVYKNVGVPEREESLQETREKIMAQMEKRFKALEDEIAELRTAGGRRRRAEEDA